MECQECRWDLVDLERGCLEWDPVDLECPEWVDLVDPADLVGLADLEDLVCTVLDSHLPDLQSPEIRSI
jgi:hypothetical protein